MEPRPQASRARWRRCPSGVAPALRRPGVAPVPVVAAFRRFSSSPLSGAWRSGVIDPAIAARSPARSARRRASLVATCCGAEERRIASRCLVCDLLRSFGPDRKSLPLHATYCGLSAGSQVAGAGYILTPAIYSFASMTAGGQHDVHIALLQSPAADIVKPRAVRCACHPAHHLRFCNEKRIVNV